MRNVLPDISTKHFTKPNQLDNKEIKRGNIHKHSMHITTSEYQTAKPVSMIEA